MTLTQQTFTYRAVDLANDVRSLPQRRLTPQVIYDTMDKVEAEVRARLGDTDEVSAGLHRLETLLESLVDRQFDKYEAYLFRNVFYQSLDPALLPHLRLAHHPPDGYDASSDSAALLKEWAEERDKADEAERSYKDARAASLRVERRIAALERARAELGDAVPRATDARTVVEALPRLRASTQKLVATPTLAPLPAETERPWDRREAFIAWATNKKLASLGLLQDTRSRPGDPLGADEDARALEELLTTAA